MCADDGSRRTAVLTLFTVSMNALSEKQASLYGRLILRATPEMLSNKQAKSQNGVLMKALYDTIATESGATLEDAKRYHAAMRKKQ